MWPAALFPLLVGAVLNMFIRGLTARRLMPLTIPFRQAASVIVTAQALAFLGQGDKNALLEPLRADVPRLHRLHRFLRWTGRDPAGSGELMSMVLDTST